MRHPDKLQPKSKTHSVAPSNDAYSYSVISGASGKLYRVWRSGELDSWRCDCKWSEYRPASNNGKCVCSHVLAVIAYVQETERSRSIKAHADLETAQRQHRKILDIGDGLYITTRLEEHYD